MAISAFLENRTPFAADKFVLPDKDGQEVMVLVVSAAFESGPSGQLKLADGQSPVRAADEYMGEPGLSSTRYEADVALEKPYADVLVNGQAYPPRGRPAREVPIRIQIGEVCKELVVSGDRHWHMSARGVAPSTPEPFNTMPIVYERAFGGTDRRSPDPVRQACDSRNPVGIGFRGAVSLNPGVRTEVPNIEYANQRLKSQSDHPAPAALGVVGRGWEPRIRFAGTYDQVWLKERWPLLPTDFDPRYHQAAPPDQQSATLRGGEMAGLLNMTPEGLWTFRLPTLDIPLRYYFDDRQVEAALRLDTVLVEPDRHRVTLTSRASIRTARNRGHLREIVLGHMSRGWLRAHDKRKKYCDYSGNKGSLPDIPHFQL